MSAPRRLVHDRSGQPPLVVLVDTSLAHAPNSNASSVTSSSLLPKSSLGRAQSSALAHHGDEARGASAQVASQHGSQWTHSPNHFPFCVAVAAALNDHRETKWYGAWSMALKDYLFRDCSTPTVACNTLPQYSLVADYDTYNATDDQPFSDSDDDDPFEDDESQSDMYAEKLDSIRREMRITGTPVTAHSHGDASPTTISVATRTLQPSDSPLVPYGPHESDSPTHTTGGFRARSSSLEYGSARGNTRHNALSTSATQANSNLAAVPGDHEQEGISSSPLVPYGPQEGDTPRTPPNRRKQPTAGRIPRRSTRVPDFVQVLQRTRQPFPHTPIEVVEQRVVLIVEVKPKRPVNNNLPFEAASLQVAAQAQHAFLADPALKAVGVITAFGNHWEYSVIERSATHIPRSLSELRDATYSMSPTVTVSSVPNSLEALGTDFELLDPEGRFIAAFRAIREHLEGLHSDIWKPALDGAL